MNFVHLIGFVSTKDEIWVKRKSGATDFIPIKVDDYFIGKRIEIVGKLLSENIFDNGKMHLKLSIHPYIINETDKGDLNEVNIDLSICKEPVFRHTPKGKQITNLLTACNENNETTYIPCIYFSRMDLQVKDKINVHGRLQSRDYLKDNIYKRTHELLMQKIQLNN